MWAYMHECGKPAFYMLRFPEAGEICRSSDARHLDGREIIFGEPMKCDSCGGYLQGPFPLRSNLKELPS